MNPPPPTSLWRLCWQLLLAIGYLALIARGTSFVTDRPFAAVFAVVGVGAVLLCALALFWLARWALRDDCRPGQFGIGSMMLLAVFVAVFFGVIRWLVDNSGYQEEEQKGIGAFAEVGVICLVLTATMVPFLLLMTESLLWASVWLVRRSCVQRWLSTRRE